MNRSIGEYFEFLEKCKDKCYDDVRTQSHHIVPKKMGGDDRAENLVELSYEDHEKAHFILADCFEENSYERNMNIWSARVIRKQSELTEEEWNKISESMSGENNPFYGKTHSEETKKTLAEKAREQRKGKSYEEIYGESRAKKERKKRAKKTRTDEEYARDAKKGENHGSSKLSRQEAKEIKYLALNSEKTQKEIGHQYGISNVTVSQIKTGERWNHIDSKNFQK